MGRLVSQKSIVQLRKKLRRMKKRVVFTNGTFDILHRGHVDYLAKARQLGDVLVIGLNTDVSIRRIKGPGRPVNRAADRAAVLCALAAVDYVCLFGDDTPLRLIRAVRPDVLVKGADWKMDQVVGREEVENDGGVVRLIPLTRGRSTTTIINRIRKRRKRKRTE